MTFLDIENGATGATGNNDLSAWMGSRATYKILCTCAASITWVLKRGMTAARSDSDSQVGTSILFVGNEGPWDYADISWSGNGTGAAVYIDVIVGTD